MKANPKNFQIKMSQRNTYLIITLIVAVTATAAIYQYTKAAEYKRSVNMAYNRAFYELVDYVDNIDVALSKIGVVNSAHQFSSLSRELWRESAFASANLGQLPLAHSELDNTAKFISQVGNYTYSLSEKVARGEQPTQKDKEYLKSLRKFADKLNKELRNMQNDLNEQKISFSTMEQAANRNLGNKNVAFGSAMETVEKEFVDYPSLIYDGPFSDHIKNRPWKMLADKKVVDSKTAINNAKYFLADKGITDCNLIGEGVNKEETYNIQGVTYNKNREVTVEVSKKGGLPLLMIDSRIVEAANISVADTSKIGKAFLEKNGFHNMKESYYQRTDNTVLINYAYVDDETVCYPDLIKVKVALDNGEVIGFEAMGYMTNHENRQIPQSKITRDEAIKKVNTNIKVESVNSVLIPSDSTRDVYCYELKGKYDNKNYLIYINMQTGDEEKILMLLEDENGVLTI